MSGGKKHPISPAEGQAATEALDHRVAMDKLREIVTSFETDDDELSRDEIEAARALPRHDHRRADGPATRCPTVHLPGYEAFVEPSPISRSSGSIAVR
ncbi:hypothetical protein [Streptomyces sp. NPDC003077]|uniref:hypothetical protein n=1 Tax=Streptomyces sp. NPDC003077 TaxID=3154443 RepID=UPI0033B17C8F